MDPIISFVLASSILSIWWTPGLFVNRIVLIISRWIRGNCRLINYTKLAAAVELKPQLNQTQVGTRVILPSSFSGSTRHMQAACQDALAVNRHFKDADLFITMTANPNWKKIKDALLPGEKPKDCPDLVNCVFHAKRNALIKGHQKWYFWKMCWINLYQRVSGFFSLSHHQLPWSCFQASHSREYMLGSFFDIIKPPVISIFKISQKLGKSITQSFLNWFKWFLAQKI